MARYQGLSVLGATALLAALPAAAQTVGVNAAVVNDVRMTTDANRTVHKAAVKERVSLGNDIITGKASRLQVLLLDKTSFTLGANARIRVDRFVYDPARSSSAVGLSVVRGAFRFMSGRATHNAPGQSSIHTPSASMGIRGTMVDGVVGEDAIAIARAEPGLPAFDADPATASLFLLRGPGAAAEGEAAGAIDVTAGGTTVAVTSPGMAVFVPGTDKQPIGPFQLSPAGADALADLLRNPDDAAMAIAGSAPAGPAGKGRFEAPTRQLPQVVGKAVPKPGGAVAGDPTPALPPVAPPRI